MLGLVDKEIVYFDSFGSEFRPGSPENNWAYSFSLMPMPDDWNPIYLSEHSIDWKQLLDPDNYILSLDGSVAVAVS